MNKKNSDCCLEKTGPYPDHAQQLKGINRISGQLDGVKKMIAERRYCPDILIQLRAARAALKTIEGNILETHLSACVRQAYDAKNPHAIDIKIAELQDLLKRFGS